MYDRHSVDEEHDVTPSVAGKRVGCVEHGLFGNLIAAAATCDLLAIIKLQRHFLAKMSLVIGIVALDGDGFAVDEGVQLYRSTAGIDLFDYLVGLDIVYTSWHGGEKNLFVDRLNAEGVNFWNNRKKYLTQLKDIRTWSELVLSENETMMVYGY